MRAWIGGRLVRSYFRLHVREGGPDGSYADIGRGSACTEHPGAAIWGRTCFGQTPRAGLEFDATGYGSEIRDRYKGPRAATYHYAVAYGMENGVRRTRIERPIFA